MPLAVSQTPTIGAEIRGIDLSQDISQENVEWLEAQLVRHKVIFSRSEYRPGGAPWFCPKIRRAGNSSG